MCILDTIIWKITIQVMYKLITWRELLNFIFYYSTLKHKSDPLGMIRCSEG